MTCNGNISTTVLSNLLLGGCAIQIPLSLKGPSRATNAKYVNAHTLPYMHFDFVDLWGTVEIFSYSFFAGLSQVTDPDMLPLLTYIIILSSLGLVLNFFYPSPGPTSMI